VSDQAPDHEVPRWLRGYKRIWLWLAAALTGGCLAAAAYSRDKFYVILFAATGGASLVFLYQGILFKLVIGPRLKRNLPPSN
jgi:hypothetical protein